MTSTIIYLKLIVHMYPEAGRSSEAATQAYKKDSVALMIQEFFVWFALFFRMYF